MATRDSVTKLYAGKYTIEYKDGNHRYYLDGTVVPSVTTILGQVIAKPELLVWPLNLALKELEEKLPHITKEDINLARYAHVRKRDSGSSTGTAVHYLAEQRLKMPLNRYLDIQNVPQEVALAAMAFESWYIQMRPKVEGVEKVVYSPSMNYVGTYDSILVLDGTRYLCDLKTANAGKYAPKGVYAEHFVQLGAYYAAYQEQQEYEEPIDKRKYKPKPIDDLMVISARKDGVVDTVKLSSLGMTPRDAADMWWKARGLHSKLDYLKRQLAGGNL